MGRLVMKFGGTSVADIERIRNVAGHVEREVAAGHKVAVVVSAMSGTTDQLVAWTREASSLHDAREYDTVVSTGEQVTCGLLAITLQGMGISARSWLGWQIPIKTNNVHGSARITGIEADAIANGWEEGQVAVVAGFQGMADDNRITTLGRGGSDTSAVALAAALGARCDIYTDVDGVYTTDPRIVPKARKLDRISYEEMLEMASLGAKVLQTRSVEMAMTNQVALQVRSSFDPPEGPFEETGHGYGPGTLVCGEEDIVEKQIVSGIAYSKNEAKVTLVRVQDKPGVAARICESGDQPAQKEALQVKQQGTLLTRSLQKSQAETRRTRRHGDTDMVRLRERERERERERGAERQRETATETEIERKRERLTDIDIHTYTRTRTHTHTQRHIIPLLDRTS